MLEQAGRGHGGANHSRAPWCRLHRGRQQNRQQVVSTDGMRLCGTFLCPCVTRLMVPPAQEVAMAGKCEVPPLKAIRLKCLACCLGQAHEVRLCPSGECASHPYRFGRKQKAGPVEMTSLRAIRARCLDCSTFAPSQVRNCPIVGCALYPFRMGKNPNRAGLGRKPPSNGGLASSGVSEFGATETGPGSWRE
jgi:hypothetical protein